MIRGGFLSAFDRSPEIGYTEGNYSCKQRMMNGMNQLLPSVDKRLRACFLLCMLCTLCTNVNMLVGMRFFEKVSFVTSDIQLAAAMVFLILAVRRPISRMAGWQLAFGIAFICWLLITRYMHALFGEPPEIVGVYMSRYLVLLPFAELCNDTDKCRGLKGAAVLTWGLCLVLCLLSLPLLLGCLPQWLSQDVYWSGARLNTLWNPIIFATILFMGLALCVAGCFVLKKPWQRALLILGALIQFCLISLTHSRTVILCICAFLLGTCLFALGRRKLLRSIAWLLVGVCLAGVVYVGSESLYMANNRRLIEETDFEGAGFQINEQGILTDGVTNQGSLKEDMGSLNGRSTTWAFIYFAFRDSRELRLFGTSQFRERIRPDIAHAHNSWLQMLVQMGIPGLLLSLVLTAQILIACARVVLRCQDPAKLTITMWVLSMLPIGLMEPFLFNTAHLGDLFILASGYLWSWGKKA